ncbi:hypothetical protein [Methylobacterium sp. PvR107]|uniref:hypothetical protein n=1 Tax=Methylobacterium sp. PvR107 TaxID=2806597 RepID=UPI001AEA2B5B|nr:hypothetical protein [Methylobacterium sp. PvR107]MBP1182664.1 hypothetical protein [Methylobacterium sp. PvR107]
MAIVDDVTQSVRASGNYRNPTKFGSQVHIEVARRVNSQKDPDFTAEILINPFGRPLNPRNPGNVRLNLLENVTATQTVCAYDRKTGHSQITMARAAQLAATALRKYPYPSHSLDPLYSNPQQTKEGLFHSRLVDRYSI